MKARRQRIRNWTVDYGDIRGPTPCEVPHAWRQDVDVRWEGPAVYRTRVQVPEEPCWLLFHGVSYQARVFADDALLGEHRGIWDAFSFPLNDFAGKEVEVKVEVVKNGGKTFPVKDVLSGFLPYVFNTFGGTYQDVELVESDQDPVQSSIVNRQSSIPRVRVDGTKLFVDGKPFYLRAPLTWGWYPELGHTNPPDKEIRREVRLAKKMGFNTMKFCLWVPPHRYFEVLDEEGMFAWLELPLWGPTSDPEKQEAMCAEMERITRQYAHHSNIIVWTCGCELSGNTTAEFRELLYKMVKGITGCPLVKDNSGGSEMYGGDLREFGDFYDFHPYCDLPFYPQVLDSLLIGPRKKMPILLGEFNDVDVFRDLARLRNERPYWTSTDSALNDQGVRWEPPVLPRVLEESRFAETGDKSDELIWQSWFKAYFVRQRVQRLVRERGIAGYVVTGWRDTPISSSGLVDDWGHSRLEEPTAQFDFEADAFLVPFRKPPWKHGGNRPGWSDPYNHFDGPVTIQVGFRSSRARKGLFRWEVCKLRLKKGEKVLPTIADGITELAVRALEPGPALAITWNPEGPGLYWLFVTFGKHKASFPLHVFRRPSADDFRIWSGGKEDVLAGVPFGNGPNHCAATISERVLGALTGGHKACLFLIDQGTRSAPYWRESAYQCELGSSGRYWSSPEDNREPLAWFSGTWEVHDPVSPDRVIDLDALYAHLPKKSEIKVLINRIDLQTYKEAPIMVEVRCGKGRMLATTLRPYGGLGCQPYGVMNNPAGAALLESMMRYLEESPD